MKITVLGASGGSGQAVTSRLASRGHEVIAVTRRGSANVPAGVQAAAADLRSAVGGPGAFFRAHTGVFVLALAGALGASCYASLEARRTRPPASLRWWALAGLTAVQAAGIVVARQRATRASVRCVP